MDHHEKLAWSAQHLHALDLEIKDFVEGHPFTARCHHREGTREFQVIVEDMPFLPSHWPLMAGDAIHNMRSALDHLIWALTDRSETAPSEQQALKVGFPVCTRAGSYFGEGSQRGNGARKRQAGWVGDAALEIIDRLQPFTLGDTAHEHPLSVLAAYSNEDKHRNLVATAVLATSVKFKMSHSGPGAFSLTGFEFQHAGRWLDNGADLGTVVFNEGTTCDGLVVEPVFDGRIVFGMGRDTTPLIDVTSLEEVLYAIHTQVVSPLDDVLYGTTGRHSTPPPTVARNA